MGESQGPILLLRISVSWPFYTNFFVLKMLFGRHEVYAKKKFIKLALELRRAVGQKLIISWKQLYKISKKL